MKVLFLIGYRGSGKSNVARLLAENLGWSWADADAVLEQKYGRTIRQIFAEEGEAGFRDKETAVLGDLTQLDKHVVATGGGIVLRPENRAQLRTGKVAWLAAPADVLWKRMHEDTTTAERRPNLAQGGLAEVEEMLRLRAPLYAACADWMVDTTDKTPEDVASEIGRLLADEEMRERVR